MPNTTFIYSNSYVRQISVAVDRRPVDSRLTRQTPGVRPSETFGSIPKQGMGTSTPSAAAPTKYCLSSNPTHRYRFDGVPALLFAFSFSIHSACLSHLSQSEYSWTIVCPA